MHQSEQNHSADRDFIESLTSSFLNSSLLQFWQAPMQEEDGIKMARTALDDWLQLLQTQQGVAEGFNDSFARPEEVVKNVFDTLTNVYEQEASKLLNVPQVGLTRFYQERMNRCTDEFNRFALEMGQFLGMLISPMEKAFAELNQAPSDFYGQEGVARDPQKVYKEWIKILEKHYLELFRSPEFTQTLHRVLFQYTAFQEVHQRIFKELLKFSPISSKDEFDEVAKENYHLKKEIKQMKKRLEAVEEKLHTA